MQSAAPELMTVYRRFQALFQSDAPYHYTHLKGRTPHEYLKVPTPAGERAFDLHLGFSPGLTAIANCRDGSCWWGAIDWDERPTDLGALAKRVELASLPLIACRSKSGGAHLYLFLRQPAPAAVVRAYLARCRNLLGLPADKVDIFPSHDEWPTDRDVGGINLPYAGGTTRFAVGTDGKDLSLEDFTTLAENAQVSAENLEARSGPGPKGKATGKAITGRNNYLLHQAGKMYAGGMTREAVESAIHTENKNATAATHPNFADGPLPESDVTELLKNAWRLHERGDGCPAWCEEINENYAVLHIGVATAVLREHQDPVGDEPLLSLGAPGQLAGWFANKPMVRRGKIAVKANTAWMESRFRRQYLDGLTFAPGRVLKESVYNIWRGWGVDPNEGSCEKFLAHVKSVICSDNEEYNDYLIKWLAHLVQFPMVLPEVAVVLQGPNGVGKGGLVQYVSDMVRPHFAHLQDSDRLTARFNAHVMGKLIVYSDEAFFAGDRSHVGQIKGLITERSQILEKKFQEPISVKNYTRLIIASNEEHPFPADLDTRRFFDLDVSPRSAGDMKYFSDLAKERDNGGPGALLKFLHSVDLTEFDVRKFPKTDALARQKSRSLDSEGGFVLDLLHRGSLPGREEEPGVVPFELLFEAYLVHAKNHGAPRRSLETSLSLRLKGNKNKKGLLKPDKISSMTSFVRPTGRYTDGIEKIERKRGTVWRLPSLDACRRAFEEQAGQPFDWESGPGEWITFEDTPYEDPF